MQRADFFARNVRIYFVCSLRIFLFVVCGLFYLQRAYLFCLQRANFFYLQRADLFCSQCADLFIYLQRADLFCSQCEDLFSLQCTLFCEMCNVLLYGGILPGKMCPLWASVRDIDLRHQGQFLTPDSQIQKSCSKKTSFHFRFVMFYFFASHNNRKSFHMSTIRLNRKCSKVVGISSSIFDNVRKSSANRRKFSEVARTFSEITVMTRQKSHAFDPEKVGRYSISVRLDA